jgi:hypothetical protein
MPDDMVLGVYSDYASFDKALKGNANNTQLNSLRGSIVINKKKQAH